MVGITRIAGCGVALALGFSSLSAAAYCRTLSCELGVAGTFHATGVDQCESDLKCQSPEGSKPLHWDSPCLTYAVQRDGSEAEGIDAATLQQLVADAFEAWESVTCPGGGSPRFHAQFQGYVGCDRKEMVCGTPAQNVNVVMFHDTGWPRDPAQEESTVQMALTSPVAGLSTGRIVDADLEINSEENDFPIDDTGFTPLRYVLAHEVGHFLGLGHSNQEHALMAPSYMQIMSSQALLGPDDIAGICAIFPPGKALECEEPPPPAYDECQLPVEPETKEDCKVATAQYQHDSGCAFAGVPPAPGAAGLVGLLALGLVAARRRRRR